MEDSILLVPKKNNIRIREQEGKYIVFNLETSGFHMLSNDARELLEAIDGTKTIQSLGEMFAEKTGKNKDELAEQFVKFLKDLELRRVISFCNA